MKKKYCLFLLVLIFHHANAQRYTTEKSQVTFFSKATLEDITASNTKASGLFNAATGDIAFAVPINGFNFAKSLMQEHFNEKYMETEKYPRSTFQGKVEGFNATAKEQNVTAKGKLTIHGVTRDVDIPGTIERQGDKLIMKSEFIVKLADYNITIPQLLWQNIAEQVKVTVHFTYIPQ